MKKHDFWSNKYFLHYNKMYLSNKYMFFWTFYSLKNPKKLYQGIAKNIYLP